ncbi:MAG: hypothetical protein FWD79_06655 [Desulfobulbus sp.]|nr:hypothetical protein [Desulfobulbus sp.]
MIKLNKFLRLSVVFIISSLLISCGNVVNPNTPEGVDKLIDMTAFLFGNNSGMIIKTDKKMSNKGCNFNFADFIGNIIYNKFISEGIHADKVKRVFAVSDNYPEWSKKENNNENFSKYIITFNHTLSFIDKSNTCYFTYIYTDKEQKNTLYKNITINFSPDNYNTDSNTCHDDFQKISQPVIDFIYHELVAKTSKSDL